MWVTQTSEILMWQLLQDLQIMFHRCWYVFIYFSSIYILGFEGRFFSVIFQFHLQFTQRAARKIKNCLHCSLPHYSKTSCEAALALRRDGRRASNSYVRSNCQPGLRHPLVSFRLYLPISTIATRLIVELSRNFMKQTMQAQIPRCMMIR